MKNFNRHNSLNFAVNMSLFSVFALFLTLVLLTGASSFRRVAAATEERFSERTALLYVTQKIRGYDRADAVKIGEVEGVPALVLTEYFEGGKISVYIYAYDGFLRELVRFDDDLPFLNLGTALYESAFADFDKPEPNLLKITINGGGVYVNLSSGTGSGGL